MSTVEFLRRGVDASAKQISTTSTLCGLDLYLLAGRGEQEIVFVGLNPAQSRLFEAVTDESEGFTLSPISATFRLGRAAGPRGDDASYFTVGRGGVFNVAVGSSTRFLMHMQDLLGDFELLGTLSSSIDRPVYRSRNSQKRAILASISA